MPDDVWVDKDDLWVDTDDDFWQPEPVRVTKNTDSCKLGVAHGMGFRMARYN